MKNKNSYICQECGFHHKKWLGKCDNCNSWNSIVEEIKITAREDIHQTKGKILSTVPLIYSNDGENEIRYDSGIEELNRVLGGGLVLGSIILLTGEPGIGKSTLLLQMCDQATRDDFTAIYASGEESEKQIVMRSTRIGISNEKVHIISSINVSDIIATTLNFSGKRIVIIDSIQTIYHENASSTPGTVNQVKFCAFEIIKLAKLENIIVVIVGHVTKEGQVAGPKLLEHMVDTVLSFEGEKTGQYRILRTIKNRFGSTNEVGVFAMSGSGLLEVKNPSNVFISDHRNSGVCVFAGVEGSRSILLEIQSLVVHSVLPTPKRSAVGLDYNRLAMLIAILDSRFGISLINKEIYINIAGGLKIQDTAADLPVMVALLSSVFNIIIPHDIIFFGEIGLAGEVRVVPQISSRIKEGIKMGFKKVVCPHTNSLNKNQENIDILLIKHIKELKHLFTLTKK